MKTLQYSVESYAIQMAYRVMHIYIIYTVIAPAPHFVLINHRLHQL